MEQTFFASDRGVRAGSPTALICGTIASRNKQRRSTVTLPDPLLKLPDKSLVKIDTRTLRFCSADSCVRPDLPTTLASATPVPNGGLKVDFKSLAKCLQKPHLRFGECFRRISSDHPRYSPKHSVHDIDVTFLTRFYEFPGSYRGGMFSSADWEWRFLDGGISRHIGYGWGNHSWTVVQGAEALRAVCMFSGIQQPLRIRGEPPRRPLSALLEEMSRTPKKPPPPGLTDFFVPDALRD